MNHYNKVINLFDSYATQAAMMLNNYSLNPKRILRNIRLFKAKTYLQRKMAKKVIENAKSINWNESHQKLR